MRRHPIGNGICAPRIPRELAALIAALQLKGATTEGLLELQEHEWESLLKFCDPAHLTLPLAQVAVSGFPLWVGERLKKNLADNAARFSRVETTYREVAAALDQAGVEYVVLKGFTQAPDYVSDVRLRMQSDLDLYCRKEMIVRARDALMNIGYQSEQTIDYSRSDHLPTMIRKGDWQWGGNAFDPEMPLSVELHFCLWNETVSKFPVPETDRFWERRIRRSLVGLSFPDLHPIDHLGFMALHILRGLLAGDWIIHHVHEMATFLHRHAKEDAFWRHWKEAHNDSFRALQAIAFFLARCWFCCDIHSDVQSQIEALPPVQTEWLERFAGSALENMFRKNKDSAWLHASLIKAPHKKVAAIWQAIMPLQVRGIPTIDNPAVRTKNRQYNDLRISNKYIRYVLYISDRTIDHLRPIPALVMHGLLLWLSSRQPRKQFHQ
ncbi:nucleotidyltransferase family protein [Alloacidobacterium sp.]|uniref:nucleotidyltransferase family protein n=1 Tax=Alloacidobacterium sp. TaxID=2951999 RepID=UPI002D26B44A|nr:nucleotidyltransferase family protein [Alloacidobacterium sp.]HYK37876.1 nucleotidyltransferase family protein [Alloacidobacterium sp.]